MQHVSRPKKLFSIDLKKTQDITVRGSELSEYGY